MKTGIKVYLENYQFLYEGYLYDVKDLKEIVKKEEPIYEKNRGNTKLIKVLYVLSNHTNEFKQVCPTVFLGGSIRQAFGDLKVLDGWIGERQHAENWLMIENIKVSDINKEMIKYLLV